MEEEEEEEERFFTFCLSSPQLPFEPCAGMIHLSLCILNLVHLSKKLGRIPLLFPPRLTLHPSHNNFNILPEDTLWAKYFEIPDDIFEDVPLYNRITTPISSAFHCSASTPLEELKDIKNKFLVVHFFDGWCQETEDAGKRCDCASPKVLGNNGTGWDRLLLRNFLGPSFSVRRYAEEISRRYHPFTILHVRRGDLLEDHSLVEKIERITHPENISAVLNSFTSCRNVIIMTNEEDINWKDKLRHRLTQYNTLYEEEMVKEKEDSFYTYEVMRTLGDLASFRIITIKNPFKKPAISLDKFF